MDDITPETDEQAAARIAAEGELSTDSKITTQVDPVPPVDADVPPASPPATEETNLDQIQDVTHTIEHRCFGRPSADQPVIVTTYRS